MEKEKFVPREKLSKRRRRALDRERRAGWGFSPVTRRVESKKAYDRKRKSRDRYGDDGAGFFMGQGPMERGRGEGSPPPARSLPGFSSGLRGPDGTVHA